MTQVSASDLQWYLTNPGAVTGFSGVGTPGNSLGKYLSTTQVSGTPLNNLFLDITGAQNAASQVDYQCIFLLNATATGNSALNTQVFMPSASDVAGGASFAYALDTHGIVGKTQSPQQAIVIANSTTAPGGISSWTGPSATIAGGLTIGNIAPNNCIAIWLRRTAANTSAVNNDGGALQIIFDSNG
jgi:hypothetical protein